MNETAKDAHASPARIKIVSLRYFGYGYKFTVQTFYPNGAVHRSLACATYGNGMGLIVAGQPVNLGLNWRGMTLEEAQAKLEALFADNPRWLVTGNQRVG
jgi:hypothetical protein